MSRDKVYSLPRDSVGQFRFDQNVASVFPDMIARSVPGYASILSVIEQLAARYVEADSNVYDLGCSRGAATTLVRGQSPRSATIHAVDNSEPMIRFLKDSLAEQDATGDFCDVKVHQQDLQETLIENASLVILNFTLQFIPAEEREGLLEQVIHGMRPGGALVLSEKICFDDPGQQALMTELHLDFKRACGYSELEIAQKRTALENTLIPETLPAHVSRLRRVGFSVVSPWFQCFNFVSILAVKQGPVA